MRFCVFCGHARLIRWSARLRKGCVRLFSYKSAASQLTEIANLADGKKISVTVDTVFPLAEARRAQELSRRGRTRGKLALRVI